MPGAKTWVLKNRTFDLSTLLYEHAKSAVRLAFKTPCLLNLQTNQISIGISRPLASLTSRYQGKMSRVSLTNVAISSEVSFKSAARTEL